MGHPANRFTEAFDALTVGADATWTLVDLAAFGVPAHAVVHLIGENTATGAENDVGAQKVGGGDVRLIKCHEAEMGGTTPCTFIVQTDSSSDIELYSETDADVVWHLMGWLSTD